MEVEGPLARGVLLEHRVVAVDRALGLARRPRRVVHDRVVVAGGVDAVEDVGGGRHEVLVADVAVGERLGAAAVLVDDDDVPEVGAGGEDVGDALAEVGGGDEDGCAAVLEAVADGVGAEGGEEGAGDAAGLEGAEDGDVGLGEAVHEEEDAVALGCAEAAEDVGELVGFEAHLVEGVALLLHVLAHPEHGEAVAAALHGVPVDALPADVEAAAGEPADLPVDSGPVERGRARRGSRRCSA